MLLLLGDPLLFSLELLRLMLLLLGEPLLFS